jgi:Domain of unknown function (DUF4349)
MWETMMYLRFYTLPLLALLLVGGCGQRAGETAASEELASMDVKDVSADAAIPMAEDDSVIKKTALDVAAPQIAYSYTYAYQVDEDHVGIVQSQHVAMCDRLGVTQCRIVSMKREASDGQFTLAALSLEVNSKIARSFGQKLDAAVAREGGETANREITAEDLSKQIIDTEARIKAKQALADRLMILLQNRSGKVGELVEAERAFAEAQEELDAARTWLREMQTRVSMSKIDISYASYSPAGGGLLQPVRAAFASIGQTLGESIGAAMTCHGIALGISALGHGLADQALRVDQAGAAALAATLAQAGCVDGGRRPALIRAAMDNGRRRATDAEAYSH